MEDCEEIIIDDENKKWRAVVNFLDTVAWLSFVTKPSGIPIQGDIDDVLGFEDIPTGIDDLMLFADDGSFLVDFTGYTPERVQKIRQPLINYFKELYEKNKRLFKKGVKKTLKDYDEL